MGSGGHFLEPDGRGILVIDPRAMRSGAADRGASCVCPFSRETGGKIVGSADGAVAEGRLYGLQTLNRRTNVPPAGWGRAGAAAAGLAGCSRLTLRAGHSGREGHGLAGYGLRLHRRRREHRAGPHRRANTCRRVRGRWHRRRRRGGRSFVDSRRVLHESAPRSGSGFRLGSEDRNCGKSRG